MPLSELDDNTTLRSWDLISDIITWDANCPLLLGHDARSPSLKSSVAWKDLIHPDDRERIIHSLSRSLADHSTKFWCEEYQILHKDGQYLTVIDQLTLTRKNGQTISAVGSMFNPVQRQSVASISNTSRNQLLNEIRSGWQTDSTILLKTILQNTTSGLFLMDSKGHPQYMNEAAEKITGYHLDEIRHRPLHYAVHWKKPDGSPYPMEECPIDNAQAKLTAAQNMSEIFVDKFGRLFPVIWSVRPLEERGRTTGAIVEFRDVTEEQKVEKEKLTAMLELKHAESRAVEAARHQQSLADFIDYLSHEIRNPLHGITANTEFLAESIAKLESATATLRALSAPQTAVEEPLRELSQFLLETRGYIGSVKECCRHQAAITDSVLDLSRLEAGNPVLQSDIFDPVAVASAALDMMHARSLEQKIYLKLDSVITRDSFLCEGDSMRLKQIYTNLLSNSCKFTKAGKTATLNIYQPIVTDDTVEFRSSVIDEGIGMTQSEVAGLFKRFGKTTRSLRNEGYSGSGLGLSITATLTRLLGGSISVESHVGIGTKMDFTVRFKRPSQLQCTNFQQQRQQPDMLVDSGLANGHAAVHFRLILVAEDNKLNQKVLAKYLTTLGYEFVMTNDGQEAVERFQDTKFDCIILDLEMPRMDGRQAASTIRQLEIASGRQRIPIIGLSGNARKEQADEALASGFDDYLTKPCKRELLGSTLASWEEKVRDASN